MATRLEAMLEADKRGLLTGDQKSALDEAKKRGLIQGGAIAEPPKQGTNTEELARQGGLTARHAIQGVANVGAGMSDAFNMAINGVLEKLGVDYRQPMAAKVVDDALTGLGFPVPENAAERVVGDASQFVAGGSGMVKGGQMLANGANEVIKRVGGTLSANPLMQQFS